jgi:hypothetical protein
MAYQSIARWLYDEASSGQAPTTVADDTGNSNDLNIDYAGTAAEWTSIAAGNGLDFTAAPTTNIRAVTELIDIATNGNIGISVVDIEEGSTNGARLSQIGTSSGNGDFGIIVRPTDISIRWDRETGGTNGEIFYGIPGGSYPTGVVVIVVLIDTTLGTNADRCKVYYNNVLQSQTSGSITQNSTVNFNQTNRNFTSFNRAAQNRNTRGIQYYEEIGTGILTTQQISDLTTALLSDNDSDWNAGGITGTGSAQSQDSQTSGSGIIQGLISGTGIPQAQSATTSGSGLRLISGSGSAVSQSSFTSGIAIRVITSTGSAQAQDSSTSGTGDTSSLKTGLGSAQAQNAITSGNGLRLIPGTGSAIAQSSNVSGVGIVEGAISGAGSAQAQSSQTNGVGERKTSGIGSAQAQDSQTSGTGTNTGTETGLGSAQAQDSQVSAAGNVTQLITGTGSAIAQSSQTKGFEVTIDKPFFGVTALINGNGSGVTGIISPDIGVTALMNSGSGVVVNL